MEGVRQNADAFREGVAVVPDGRSLALLTSQPNRLVVWNTDLSSWKRRACQLVGRNFTRDEWNVYVGPDKPYEPACPQLRVG